MLIARSHEQSAILEGGGMDLEANATFAATSPSSLFRFSLSLFECSIEISFNIMYTMI